MLISGTVFIVLNFYVIYTKHKLDILVLFYVLIAIIPAAIVIYLMSTQFKSQTVYYK